MIKSSKRSFIGMLVLAVLALSLPVLSAAPPKAPVATALQRPIVDINTVCARLRSSDVDTVVDSLSDVEKLFPDSTNAILIAKQLITDPRSHVKRKAMRVLGVIHAPMDETDIQNICAALKSHNPREVIDALISLRDLNASLALPEVLPCLNNSNSHIIRDACRTLAVIGGKDTVNQIQPLLKNSDSDIRQDAKAAIERLQAKP